MLVVVSPRLAHAVTRTCGPDGLANTEAVLCAPPSGPCDASLVTLGANVKVKDGGCVFDLGGRALRVERTFRMHGSEFGGIRGFIRFLNVGDVTVTKRGKLKARGDFVRPDGFIIEGGDIEIVSTGTIRVAGLLDVSGDLAGLVDLEATSDVIIERRAKIRGNGITSFVDEGGRFADGGLVLVKSRAGSITVDGAVTLRGANQAEGGTMELAAALNVTLNGPTDASGGSVSGGDVSLGAGDHVEVTRSIDVSSRGGGDDGGAIFLEAGVRWASGYTDIPGGVVPGGSLTVRSATFNLQASANDDSFAGLGGDVLMSSCGPLTIATDVVIRADSATSPENTDGDGGFIEIDSGFCDVGQPLDGTLTVGGIISARSGNRGGIGGVVNMFSAGDMHLTAAIDVSGRDAAGEVKAASVGALRVSAPLSAQTISPVGAKGSIELIAGFARVAPLTVERNIVAGGGALLVSDSVISLTGCPVTVAEGVKLDARTHPSVEGPYRAIELIAGRPMQLGPGSQYLAGSGGVIFTTHPPTVDPVIGDGVVFRPGRVDYHLVSASLFATCPRCGEIGNDSCAPLVHIDSVTTDGNRLDASVQVSSPLGLPLDGTIEICEAPAIDDLTYTWLADSCDGADTFELTINGITVAAVPGPADYCLCNENVPFSTFTVPVADAEALLVPGLNRLGIRKSTGLPDAARSLLAWAYATISVGGVSQRVPIFDQPELFDPFGAELRRPGVVSARLHVRRGGRRRSGAGLQRSPGAGLGRDPSLRGAARRARRGPVVHAPGHGNGRRGAARIVRRARVSARVRGRNVDPRRWLRLSLVLPSGTSVGVDYPRPRKIPNALV